MKYIGGVLAWIIFMTVVRGTDKVKSFIGVDYCGWGYWILFLIFVGGIFYIFGMCKRFVQDRLMSMHDKEKQNYHTCLE
jgi:hypothetical protein